MKRLMLFLILCTAMTFADEQKRHTLLIKIPTKDRYEQFFNKLDIYIQRLSGEVDVIFLISCDAHDKTMHNHATMTRLDGYKHKNSYTRLYYYFGQNKSKIEAYNKDINKHMDFDVLLVASDDMEPVVHGYDKIIIDRMIEAFPDFDGVLNFFDGHQGADLNTMPVIGKKYYERFGYIYHPAYKSFWCDNEFTQIAKLLGKERVCDEMIIVHKHPYWGTAPTDASYNYNNQFGPQDQKIYQQRAARNFDLGPILQQLEDEANGVQSSSSTSSTVRARKKWSILIPTLVERRAVFNRIYNKLMGQIKALGLEQDIEILVYEDNRQQTVGYKRNKLVEQSTGEYTCFVDDDDDVSDDYIKMIYEKLCQGPDCVALEGIITFGGKNPRRFTHSIKYTSWFEQSGVYYRPPNHLNPIKRSIAIQFKFPDIRFGEDHAWSMAIQQSGLVKSEAAVGHAYYFYLSR